MTSLSTSEDDNLLTVIIFVALVNEWRKNNNKHYFREKHCIFDQIQLLCLVQISGCFLKYLSS